MYSDVLKLCKRKFEIDEDTNCRLRHYDPGMKVRQRPIAASDDTELFNIPDLHNYACFDIEFANADG